MEKAIALAEAPRPPGPKDICAIHHVLMGEVDSDAGRLRQVQNWVGGGSFNPYGADFVPPPPEFLGELVEDLCAFLNRRDFPAIASAAIAHAQFETIHPFTDGNGRVGRALIHVILKRRGLAPRFAPPVSLVLAGNARAYIDGLVGYRDGNVLGWCDLFAAATAMAAKKSTDLAERFARLQAKWREQAGRPRAKSSASELIDLLPAYPILSVATAQQMTGRSKQAANEAMAQLEGAGVLKRTNIGKRNRAWEAQGVFDLLNDFERELAMPPGALKQGRRAPYPGRGRSKAER